MAVSAQDNRVLLNEDALSYIHGVLRVEIKEASKIYELARQERLYVAVAVGQAVKKTKSVTRTYGQASWAQTKHFPLHVDLNKKHKDNLVCVELVCCNGHPDDSFPDRPIGIVAFHLHDVIKQSPVDGVFDLFNSYQTVGEIKLSLSFSYGLFGYGYSSQLKEEQYDVDHFLSHSLFPRIDPIPARLDSSKHVLIPKATRHPIFIPFNQRIQLGFGQEIATTLDNIHDTSGKFSLLGSDMQRFNFLQDQLKREHSRANRLTFLSNLLLDNNMKSEAIKDGLEEVSLEREVSNTNPIGNVSLITLSHEEMKERGMLVVSLPKDQDKEKSSTIADNDNPAASTTSVSTNTRLGSFRSSLSTEPSILSIPHSMSTPLLNHPTHQSPGSQSPLKLTDIPPTNPRILCSSAKKCKCVLTK